MSALENRERNPMRRVLPVPCARRPVDIGKRVPAATATNVRRFGTESFRRDVCFSDGTLLRVARPSHTRDVIRHALIRLKHRQIKATSGSSVH